MSTFLEGINDDTPGPVGDSTPLLPLPDLPLGVADITSHFRQGRPRIKHFRNSLHAPDYASDELSDQERTNIPMTEGALPRTIRPMGRGTTPARFKNELGTRLKSARIVAGYKTQLDAAKAIGVELSRYSKWERGRSPIPAQYVKAICGLFGIDANYLYDIQEITHRSTG